MTIELSVTMFHQDPSFPYLREKFWRSHSCPLSNAVCLSALRRRRGAAIGIAIALILEVFILIPVVAAQQQPATASESKQERKAREKERKRIEAKNRNELETSAPLPAYYASLRPEFQVAIRQAGSLVDNAAKTITASRFEFAMANQSAQQAVALLTSSAQSSGEIQAAEALRAYAEIVPVCQQAAWDAASNVIWLLSGKYQRCQREMIRLRTVAENTVIRNSSSAPAESRDGSASSPSHTSTELPSTPDQESRRRAGANGLLTVQIETLKPQRITIDADAVGPSSEMYSQYAGASFVIAKSLRISAADLSNVKLFLGGVPVDLSGTTAYVVVEK